MQISLTSRCQLSCRYCFLDRRSPRDLPWPLARRAVEHFLQRPFSHRLISFYGGEPLLAFPLLKKIVIFVRRRYPPSRVSFHLTTNGLLLDRGVADFCALRGIGVTLSFDGRRRRHDRERVTDGTGVSSYSSVFCALTHLRAAGVPVTANMVIVPRDASAWDHDAKHIIRCGVARIDFLPELTAVWLARDIDRFKVSLGRFAEFYAGCFERADRPRVVLGHVRRLVSGGNHRMALSCDKRILAADGCYYSCDKALGCGEDQRQAYRVGHAAEGIDENCREKSLAGLFQTAAAASRGRCRSCRWAAVCFCPAGLALLSPSAAGLKRRWQAFCRLSESLLEASSGLVSRLGSNELFRCTYDLPSGVMMEKYGKS